MFLAAFDQIESAATFTPSSGFSVALRT
jgi:hypothetical protein